MEEILNEKQLCEIKNTQLNILKEFAEVCNKNDLKYYLAYGTLLGAVRHQGYIPWDDDVDVVMPREDYEKFLQLPKEELSKELFVQTIDTDKEYLNYYAKIRNSNTTFIESSASDLNINHGIFIDIFPLDYVSENITAIKKMKLKKKIIDRRISSCYKFDLKPSIRGGILNKVINCIFHDINKVIKYREKMIKKFSSGRYVFVYGEGYDKIVPSEWYGNGTDIMFEGIMFKAPSKYRKLLEAQYGDYMKLPPVEERIPHHYCDVIDLNKSYKCYMGKK